MDKNRKDAISGFNKALQDIRSVMMVEVERENLEAITNMTEAIQALKQASEICLAADEPAFISISISVYKVVGDDGDGPVDEFMAALEKEWDEEEELNEGDDLPY